MRYNQFSYIPAEGPQILQEMTSLGFELSPEWTDQKNLASFVKTCLFQAGDLDFALRQRIASWDQSLYDYFQQEQAVTATHFYQVALQLLGFVPYVDYQDLTAFIQQIHFPIHFQEGQLLKHLYQLLATRCKNGNTLVDQLVSDGLIPETNQYQFFNGKSLATFDTKDLIREVVYVESPVDTDQDGQADLVKVSILRPRVDQPIPAMMMQSPYHQGVNEPASDKALHKMEGVLAEKEPHQIKLQEARVQTLVPAETEHLLLSEATEKTGHMGTYTLNDYMLARGVASIYVSGIGTVDSDGFMTSGDYQQVLSFKAVVDWLNGRATAYTSPTRQARVVADWSNGKVATTGLSYLGTMSNALATTGVDGLELIIAEAGISSWYDYYRENGLVTSPGGYPGEDLDSLAAFTYSKALHAGDWQRNRTFYQEQLAQMTKDLDRLSGDYSQFWHDRNYLPQADKVTCEVVFTHGSQDWNVKPIHVFQMFHALPAHVKKHLFFHNGAHVYMNNWQSIDFRESMNALLTQKLLGVANHYQLPAVIWQDNLVEQTWQVLSDFQGQASQQFSLGEVEETLPNAYDEADFARYGKDYSVFHQDLYAGKAQQLAIPISLDEPLWINGRPRLHLRVKSSISKGLLSAHLLAWGDRKRHTPIPAVQSRDGMDNGRYFSPQALMELPFKQTPHRLVSKGYINLQNRTDLLRVESVPADEWMEFDWDLQPTIYRLEKGETLHLILFTTDFEVTVRDQTDYQITIDLASSSLTVPTHEMAIQAELPKE